MNENNFMKFVKLMTAGILLLVAFVIGAVVYIIYNFTMKEPVSIGVIGSADGPTSVFVSGSSDMLYVAICLVAAALTVGLVSFIISKFKR